MNLGIIAEDYSDVDVIRHITSRMLPKHNVGTKCFVGRGCGKLRKKCKAWAENLVLRGCSWIAVVHDLDVNDERTLRKSLSQEIAAADASAKVVLIPIREIESWLMYDAKAIAAAFAEKKPPKLPGNPESLSDPKNELETLIWRSYRKRYLHTVHNAVIAKHIDPSMLRHARSFALFPPFVSIIRGQLGKRRGRH